MSETKTCTRCAESKPLSDFYTLKGRHLARCRKCMNAVRVAAYRRNPEARSVYRRTRYAADRERHRLAARLKEIQRRYGVSQAEYDALLQSQDARCAICGGGPGGRDFCVDHDHRTGRVRGLLCNHCNVLLGQADDSLDVLYAAIAYLKRNALAEVA